METLKLCPRYQWTREGRAEYISLNDKGQLPVEWARECLKRDVKVWGFASSPEGKARMESLARELPGMKAIDLRAEQPEQRTTVRQQPRPRRRGRGR